MRLWKNLAVAVAMMVAPVTVFADGYKDLDTAMSAISRGFEHGDSQAIAAGVGDGDQVMLQFPGLAEKSGFFGRDQAAYVLDEVFKKAHPVRFERGTARKVSAENQYNITGSWTVKVGDRTEEREVYITLRGKGTQWSVASIRAGSR
jgi:hypothetical protein